LVDAMPSKSFGITQKKIQGGGKWFWGERSRKKDESGNLQLANGGGDESRPAWLLSRIIRAWERKRKKLQKEGEVKKRAKQHNGGLIKEAQDEKKKALRFFRPDLHGTERLLRKRKTDQSGSLG